MQATRPLVQPPADDLAQPLNVVIGASSLQSRRSGVGRMTLEIIEAVQHRPELSGLRLLMAGRLHAPDVVLQRLAAASADPAASSDAPSLALRAKRLVANVPGVQRVRRFKHQLVQRHDRATDGAPVVYYEPNMITEVFEGPTVVTVNDLSWHHHPEYHPAERIEWIGRNLRRTLEAATRFVAISRFTASAMERELGIPASRIDVVPLAAGAQFRPRSAEDAAPALARHGLGDRGYILSVSTLEPRKNFDRLVAAHQALPAPLRRRFPLVIAGGAGWGSALASPAAEQARRDGSLRLLGHLPDADLLALYARAAVFAYVSIYEGFGLPVLEAMAAGTPVLASRTTATGETAGDAADLVDPVDVHAIAEGMRRVLEHEAHAETLRRLGLAHAASFTWARTATGLIASWRRALDA